jgi:hypothetical protein
MYIYRMTTLCQMNIRLVTLLVDLARPVWTILHTDNPVSVSVIDGIRTDACIHTQEAQSPLIAGPAIQEQPRAVFRPCSHMRVSSDYYLGMLTSRLPHSPTLKRALFTI